MNDMDFIGFSYNGKHSYTDFGIYRTSDGSRYNDNLVPQMTDKTVDVPGGDGQYYFYTKHKTRQFSVQIAFDNLTELKYREMRQWLDGRAIHDLVFDELPYKVYSAKVTGTPQLKTICLEEDGQRVYKGEGTIQFTCYYPFAHTPNQIKPASEEIATNLPKDTVIPCYFVIGPNQGVQNGNLSETQSYIIKGLKIKNNNIESFEFTFKHNNIKLLNEDCDYIIIQSFQLIGCQKFTFAFLKSLSTNSQGNYNNWVQCNFTTAGYIDKFKTENGVQIPIPAIERKPKDINDYPLANKIEWAEASGILIPKDGDNFGDLPAPFNVSKESTTNPGTTFKVADCEITILEACSNLKWDSKSGLVLGTVDGTERPIKYTGKSYGTIPIGGTTDIELNGAKIEYHYWYY